MACVGCASALHAQAQQNPVVERFTDWEMICKEGESCRIGQRLAAPETGETLFAITALPAREGGPLVGIVSAPHSRLPRASTAPSSTRTPAPSPRSR